MAEEMFGSDGNEMPKIIVNKELAMKIVQEAKEAGFENLSATTDPGAKKFQDIIAKYRDQLDREAKIDGSHKARHLANFEKTIILYDGGFNDDPRYLHELLDWLDQDLQNAEDEEFGDKEVAELIKKKIEEIGKKLDDLEKE